METKIERIEQRGIDQIAVTVQFLDGENVLFNKEYTIEKGHTIEDLYPVIKEDLNTFEATRQKVADLGANSGTLDLSLVKSTSEIAKESDLIASGQLVTPPDVSPTEPLA